MNEEEAKHTRYRLGRARKALQAAHLMAEAGLWDSCVNRLYYACFYSVVALLFSRDLESKKHTGVRALFNQTFVKSGIAAPELGAFYNQIFDVRLQSDYGDDVSFDADQVLGWLSEAERFVSAIEALLPRSEPS